MAYRRTPSVALHLADNRNRILVAARAMVGEGGWSELQVSHVAAAAGLATGAVYRYFPSKAHLCVEVLSAVSQREVDVLQAIADGPGTATARLHGAVTVFVIRAMRNRRLAYALIAEPCEPEIDQARLTYRHAISEQIVRIVRAGQEAGDFRAHVDPNTAGTVIVEAAWRSGALNTVRCPRSMPILVPHPVRMPPPSSTWPEISPISVAPPLRRCPVR